MKNYYRDQESPICLKHWLENIRMLHRSFAGSLFFQQKN
ncbi:hypothetical protein BMETH_1701_0 [methanotrophic bacterial endosymbiont of Bathymodiolus sp.]|nr:hypothetical protein BMETH_1701_0 [methanotrophic bacterial endosymbiont of Bathymodiolus sp.]